MTALAGTPFAITPLADWLHLTSDVPDGGLKRERVATVSERDAIAAALKLVTLAGLHAAYRIDRLAGGGYRLHGRVTSTLQQACVVSLEAVDAQLDEAFDVEFWEAHAHGDDAGEVSVLDGPDIEPLERGEITAGRIVFETVSAALDPYPRKPSAEMTWRDEVASMPGKTSPFASLSKLKDKL
jgi:hypothetical protein